MNNAININPAEALRRIITNMAKVYRLKADSRKRRGLSSNGPFWTMVASVTGYGGSHSRHLARANGFDADTGAAL